MGYIVLKPKSKREELFLQNLIEKLNVEYKKISLKDYMRDISESRKQIKKGKKVSLSSIANGI